MKINELIQEIQAGNTDQALNLAQEIKNIGRDFSQSINITPDNTDLSINERSGSGQYRVSLKHMMIQWFGGY